MNIMQEGNVLAVRGASMIRVAVGDGFPGDALYSVLVA
jgi:hypothetical protein